MPNLLDLKYINRTPIIAKMSSLPQDLTPLLTQLKNEQMEREKFQKLYEEAQKKAEEEARLKTEAAQKAEKLMEGKRVEMQAVFENKIKAWLAEAVANEKIRQETEAAVKRLADNTDQNGVWDVMVCASDLNAKRIQELEQLKHEIQSLKSKGPEFEDDSSRKRPREEGEAPSSDVWGQFEQSMRGQSFY